MKILYQFKDWQTEPPGFKDPGHHTFDANDERDLMTARGVCPHPDCMETVHGRAATGVSAFILFEGADGEPTAIAMPCSAHAEFQYHPGWYDRFADVVQAKRYPQGETRTCRTCTQDYTEILFGWYDCQCPECSYQDIIKLKTRSFALAS